MTERNIVDLAREVLGDELGWEVKPSDIMHHEDIEAVYRLANAAPTLARAVIDLIAERGAYREQVERVKAELEQCERDSNWDSPYAEGMHEVARRASAALNGERR